MPFDAVALPQTYAIGEAILLPGLDERRRLWGIGDRGWWSGIIGRLAGAASKQGDCRKQE
jgi:hypothetical protein